MKFLHLTYHIGCRNDLEYVFPKLGHEIETMHFTDDAEYNIFGKGDRKFTVTYELAQQLWNTYKDYFDTFDAVVISDTCPLSLPFLQNHWNKPLIIWVCNRFCYGNYLIKGIIWHLKKQYNRILEYHRTIGKLLR